MISLPIIQLAGEAWVVGEVADSAWILAWGQDAERIALVPAPDHLVAACIGYGRGNLARMYRRTERALTIISAPFWLNRAIRLLGSTYIL
ncbi:hypothetical protein [Glaciimonas sp. Gout2]|uniref:hypothetical protein n=1 Tax=Glaciimonas sp. Gout2 TaxID=3048625 RepID=UPI003A599CB4